MAAPPPPPPTVLAIKHAFLTQQTRRLAQPPDPSRAWRAAHAASDAPLPPKALDDALARLAHLLAQHARRVHPPQASRHVAEQLDALYLASAASHDGRSDEDDFPAAGEGDGGHGWRSLGADLADADTIAALPPSYPSDAARAAHPPEARRYADLASRLQGLARRRDEARARVAALRRAEALLTPFAAPGVQENLVTRGGEVERELERMRVLLARVGGRVAGLADHADHAGARRAAAGGDEDEDEGEGILGAGGAVVENLEVAERRKVESVLGMMSS